MTGPAAPAALPRHEHLPAPPVSRRADIPPVTRPQPHPPGARRTVQARELHSTAGRHVGIDRQRAGPYDGHGRQHPPWIPSRVRPKRGEKGSLTFQWTGPLNPRPAGAAGAGITAKEHGRTPADDAQEIRPSTSGRPDIRSQELGPQRRLRTRRRRYHPWPGYHRVQPGTSRPSLLNWRSRDHGVAAAGSVASRQIQGARRAHHRASWSAGPARRREGRPAGRVRLGHRCSARILAHERPARPGVLELTPPSVRHKYSSGNGYGRTACRGTGRRLVTQPPVGPGVYPMAVIGW